MKTFITILFIISIAGCGHLALPQDTAINNKDEICKHIDMMRDSILQEMRSKK